MSISVRPLTHDDYDLWRPLWDGNNLGEYDAEVTTTTWRRLTDADNWLVNGVCAMQDKEMVGIVHYILHPTTGQVNPVCYMQDVYVAPNHRRKGIGKQLVTAITEKGAQEQWARMYWLTQADNVEAKAMYENFGIKLDFTFYVLPIS